MQIGELFIIGFHGKYVPTWVKEFAARYGLGGVVLFDYSCQSKQFDNNIDSPEQLRGLCAEISALPSSPLVFIDQEGGRVRRLKDTKGFVPLPSQQQFALLSESDRRRIIRASLEELRNLGIHVNFAPVLDVNYNPDNPNIGKIERAYSSDIRIVEENARLVNEEAERTRIGLCLKHYPGIGGATVDSHLDIMDLSDALHAEQEALFYRLAPQMFGNAIMVSHAIIRQWDSDLPITLSPAAIGRIRAHLPDTLIISDDMQMQGLQKKMPTKEATLHALNAGIDMVCIGNNLINEEAQMDDIAQYVLNHVAGKGACEQSIARVQQRKKLLNAR